MIRNWKHRIRVARNMLRWWFTTTQSTAQTSILWGNMHQIWMIINSPRFLSFCWPPIRSFSDFLRLSFSHSAKKSCCFCAQRSFQKFQKNHMLWFDYFLCCLYHNRTELFTRIFDWNRTAYLVCASVFDKHARTNTKNTENIWEADKRNKLNSVKVECASCSYIRSRAVTHWYG